MIVHTTNIHTILLGICFRKYKGPVIIYIRHFEVSNIKLKVISLKYLVQYLFANMKPKPCKYFDSSFDRGVIILGQSHSYMLKILASLDAIIM